MKNGGRQCSINVCFVENPDKVFRGAGSAGCHQGNGQKVAGRAQLTDIISGPRPASRHAIKDDLTGAALHHFLQPVQRGPPRCAHGFGRSGV